MAAREKFGYVTCPSGILLMIDTGYLGIWSHDQPPRFSEGDLDTQEAVERANTFVDIGIVGEDAEKAGRILDRSSHPLFIYDQPPDHPEIREELAKLIREHRWDARLEVLRSRVPHRHRVEQAIQQGAGAGEVVFHGVWAAAVSGVPTSVPLPVLAERLVNQSKLKTVFVECRPERPMVRSEWAGSVGVDYARILIADVDALGAWQHRQSLDGLADYVFWGRDAELAANAFQVPRVGPEEFGWMDVPQAVARKRGASIEDFRLNHGLKFGTDYRPHSHHWRVMKPTRESATESCTMELGGATVCNFMTTWGDGIFDVYRDLDQSSELVQIRIELSVSVTAEQASS